MKPLGDMPGKEIAQIVLGQDLLAGTVTRVEVITADGLRLVVRPRDEDSVEVSGERGKPRTQKEINAGIAWEPKDEEAAG